MWHFVCFGPIEPYSGLMYEVVRMSFLSSPGCHSEDSMSAIVSYTYHPANSPRSFCDSDMKVRYHPLLNMRLYTFSGVEGKVVSSATSA